MPVPTQRELHTLFIPLALSGILFPLASPVINACLARTPDPATALAAYSVTLSVTSPLLFPLFGLRQIATALAVDRDMLQRLTRLTLLLSGGVTALLLVAAVPPVFRALVGRMMGIPESIVAIGAPVMAVMAFFPLLAVGRGFFQGVLVHYGRPGPIGTGALVYLLGTSAAMLAGVAFTRMEGALLAALALFFGQAVYLVPDLNDTFDPRDRSTRYILQLYVPIAVSTALTALVEPAVQSAMARAPRPDLSLAAYPVCISLGWLARTSLLNVQQVVIARVRGQRSYEAVRRFVALLSTGFAGVLGLIALPLAAPFVFGRLMGLEGGILGLAASGFVWLVVTPFIQGAKSLYHGTLISRGKTTGVQLAALVRIGILALVLVAGVFLGGIPGLHLALGALVVSEAAECVFLHVAAKSVLRDAPPDA